MDATGDGKYIAAGMAVEQAGPHLPQWSQLSGPHLARYLFAADLARGKKVLDAGCGSGYGAVLLLDGGAASVDAVDIDPKMIEHARVHYGSSGANYLADDCQTLSLARGPFDLICNFENIEHLPEPRKFLAAAANLLAPGGVLITSTPDRDVSPPYVNGKPANRYHVQEWRREEFRDLLSPYFSQVEIRVQIKSWSLQTRQDAVAALGKYLSWANPVVKLVWRGVLKSGGEPAWNRLKGLACGGAADFPIVSAAAAPILGAAQFHVGICRK